jgi:hypothetical protein
MAMRQRRYSKEEMARRGKELYEQQVQAQVEAGNLGRIVAIDVESGAFQIGETPLEACHSLLAKLPDAQIWCVRIGHRAVYHFGWRALKEVS